MRVRLPPGLFAVVSLTFSGCLTTSLQVAEPVGRGNSEFSFEGGGFTRVDTAPLGAGRRTGGPIANIAVRYGLSDNVDFAVRAGTSGSTFALKRGVSFEAVPTLKLAAEVRAGILPPMGMVPTGQLAVTGVLQWSPWSKVHLLLAPNATLYSLSDSSLSMSPFFGGEPSVRERAAVLLSQNSFLMLIPAASVGVGIDVHPSARVILEAGMLLHPAALLETRQGELPFNGAIAFQWRPRDPQLTGGSR